MKREANDAAWAAALFAAIDSKDVTRFMAFLEPDAQFRFGGNQPAVGSEAIHAAVEGFFAAIKSLSHQVDHVWGHPGHVICEGIVTYTHHDSRKVSIPFCNVLGMLNGRVKDYLVYIDPAPLFAAP